VYRIIFFGALLIDIFLALRGVGPHQHDASFSVLRPADLFTALLKTGVNL
jgi:hypothetical protein